MEKIHFFRSLATARMPVQSTPGSAGFDLFSAEVTYIPLQKQIIVNTGLRVSFMDDHVLLVYGRSGLGFKHGIRLANSVGVIDSDYRGDIMLAFRADGCGPEKALECLGVGNRVAQAILMPIPQSQWVEVSAAKMLSETERGIAGFGSTGA